MLNDYLRNFKVTNFSPALYVSPVPNYNYQLYLVIQSRNIKKNTKFKIPFDFNLKNPDVVDYDNLWNSLFLKRKPPIECADSVNW